MERLLKKENSFLISQPIKGTIRQRAGADKQLELDVKERAENIMITDMVRNDLSLYTKPGSVQVEELCEVYAYPPLLHMVSTVKAELEVEVPVERIIAAAFPPASMTGAPRLAAMRYIEQLEPYSRSIYSGCIGYHSPKADFDLSVVIRTLVYSALEQELSVHAGAGITYQSIAEKEYEECALKVSRLVELLLRQ